MFILKCEQNIEEIDLTIYLYVTMLNEKHLTTDISSALKLETYSECTNLINLLNKLYSNLQFEIIGQPLNQTSNYFDPSTFEHLTRTE